MLLFSSHYFEDGSLESFFETDRLSRSVLKSLSKNGTLMVIAAGRALGSPFRTMGRCYARLALTNLLCMGLVSIPC